MHQNFWYSSDKLIENHVGVKTLVLSFLYLSLLVSFSFNCGPNLYDSSEFDQNVLSFQIVKEKTDK